MIDVYKIKVFSIIFIDVMVYLRKIVEIHLYPNIDNDGNSYSDILAFVRNRLSLNYVIIE